MKSLVSSLSFLLLLFTLSDAFHPQTPLHLTQLFDHQIQPLENKESVSEPDFIHINGLQNRYPYPLYRLNPLNCRQLHRFMRHPRRFVGVNELGFAPVQQMDSRVKDAVEAYVLSHRHVARNVEPIRVFDQFSGPHHMDPLRHDHDHIHDDDERVEMKEESLEMEERADEAEKKRKEKDYEHQDKEKDKDVLKKIRKFLPYI